MKTLIILWVLTHFVGHKWEMNMQLFPDMTQCVLAKDKAASSLEGYEPWYVGCYTINVQ